jgi:hypothetical protein
MFGVPLPTTARAVTVMGMEVVTVTDIAITAGTKQTFEQRSSEARRAAAPGGFLLFDG